MPRGKESPSYLHGQAHKPIYSVYRGMVDRCHRPKAPNYKNYGARGIKVCEEWRKDKKAFFDWAFANGYKRGLSLDRIDNNGDYSPQNCRWATTKQQANNKRTNHLIEINGETHTISEWAEISGILESTIRERIVRGWSKERLLEKPKKSYSHPKVRRGCRGPYRSQSHQTECSGVLSNIGASEKRST